MALFLQVCQGALRSSGGGLQHLYAGGTPALAPADAKTQLLHVWPEALSEDLTPNLAGGFKPSEKYLLNKQPSHILFGKIKHV